MTDAAQIERLARRYVERKFKELEAAIAQGDVPLEYRTAVYPQPTTYGHVPPKRTMIAGILLDPSIT